MILTKKAISTINHTGMEAEFAFAEVNRPTDVEDLLSSVVN